MNCTLISTERYIKYRYTNGYTTPYQTHTNINAAKHALTGYLWDQDNVVLDSWPLKSGSMQV